MKTFRTFILLFLLLLPTASSASKVYLFNVDGVINPVVSDYLSEGMKEAKESGSDAVIIQLDTPGGLMESMHQIVKEIMNYPGIVIIWVGPQGARAGSAGVFITLSADIAAMAPGTNIGAAHPVQMGQAGQMSETMEEKIVKDARAYIRSIAEKKGRNWEWAVKAVSESESITSDEALRQKVIEYVTDSIEELMEKLEGKRIKKDGREIVLTFKGKEVVSKPMDLMRQFFNALAHPNLAYVLLILGIYGLIYEFSSPGVGLGAVMGGICLILAFFSFQVLPINLAGLLLIILGIVLMLLDIKVPSHGILTAGGVIAFIIGSMMLIRSPEKYMRVSLVLILSMAITTALFFIFAISAGLRIQRKKVTTGQEGLVGMKAKVITPLAPEGQVFVHGEIWEALTDEQEKIKKDETVEIVAVEGNKLKVKKE